MEISRNKVVTIDYTLTSDQGQVLDSSQGKAPLAYLHGAKNIVPGLENALEGKSAGEALSVSIPPEEGYGQRDPKLVGNVPKAAFGEVAQIKPGMQFEAQTNQGPRVLTVVGVQNDHVTVDANHPLAGMTLNFAVTVREVRDATTDELAHGHVHGGDGHQH